MHITEDQADYLLPLVQDRITELERRLRIAVTPQEEHEVRAELERAALVAVSLRQFG